MYKLKKILTVFLFLLLVCSISPAIAQAPSASPSSSPASPLTSPQFSSKSNSPITANEIYSNVDPSVPRNLSTLTQTTIMEVLAGSVCMLSGHDPLRADGKCLGYNPTSGKIGYITGNNEGVGKFMGNIIGATMSIPISSTDYAQYAMSNFGITHSAYAQQKAPDTKNGVGYQRLRPLLGVWTRFRDIAYLAFVLAFTIIGLAIMLRVKIDARTAMTIQNQIPKVVIALILVTFSYAIAGFLIDMMYVIMYLVILTFNNISPIHINAGASVFSVFNKTFSTDLAQIPSQVPGFIAPDVQLIYGAGTSGIMGLTLDVARSISSVFTSLTADFLDSTIGELFKIPFSLFKGLELGCSAVSGTLKVVSFGTFGGFGSCDFVDAFFKGFISFVFGAIAFLVILIAILYSLFRVWLTLIKSFIYVLVDSMIGPLWIAAGIFPGSKLGFGTWIRHLMAHLSVFPMCFAVILLGKTIMDGVAQGASSGEFFNPPLIGDAFSNTHVAAIVGFGFILSIPSILEKTRKVVGAIDFGLVDVKRSLGAGMSVGKGGFASATNRDIVYKKNAAGQWQPEGVKGVGKIMRGFGIIR